MEGDENEEKLLRSVALQNAQSILLARQRAEQELIQAKAALELRTEELAHSLAMMRATLESTTDGILVTDGGGKVTGFNGNFVEMWRISSDTMNSREHRQLLEVWGRQFKDPDQFRLRVEEIYASSPPESYDLLELLDGRAVERFSKIQRIDERNVGRVWSFRDVTDRRRAEGALRQSERRFRFVMDSMPQKIFTATPNGDVDYFNPQWTEFTGLPFETIRDWGWTQFIHPDDVAENVRVWKHSIETGEYFQFEHRFRRADG
ncbi:MAG: PAS domain-containing protein, partial [Gammaproteobacteria bacterium]